MLIALQIILILNILSLFIQVMTNNYKLGLLNLAASVILIIIIPLVI